MGPHADPAGAQPVLEILMLIGSQGNTKFDPMKYTVPMAAFMPLWLDFLRSKGLSIAKTDFLPETVITHCETVTGRALKEVLIPQWGAFEQIEEEWDAAEFAQLMGIHEFGDNEPLTLVTDEGYGDRVVFQFLPTEFQDFAAWYETHYTMDFFQSSDYLLFAPDFSEIRIIHHNGVLFSGRML